MTWLAWRQHRVAVLLLLAYALAGVSATVWLGLHVRSVFADVPGCLVTQPGTGFCPESAWHLFSRVWEPGTPMWVLARPLKHWAAGFVVLAGLLVGAPLFAREYAQGTQRFVLAQSVDRRRWYLTKLAVVAVPLTLAAVASQLAYTWLGATLGPVMRVWSRFDPGEFEVRGLLLPFYTLFAVALGAVTGLLVRRSVAAITVTAATGGMLAVLVPWVLRRNFYLPPAFRYTGEPRPVLHQWVVDFGFTDGHRLLGAEEADALFKQCPDPAYEACLRHSGLTGQAVLEHPADRFWPFQYIEAGLFLLLTTGVLALGLWTLRRRTG
ncbi:hypothetical protein JOF53_001197 [Crossiella equi]|uniref:ABC-2 family transporter protein n=1 Tax=Crossiella equi TaxID=130796 RepID=A0ABS5A6W5_9PSEU|nr:ABC transporter permease subunit [Crossiella equi]MBP2472325.1 hypothetical protein [Crossiella equi]